SVLPSSEVRTLNMVYLRRLGHYTIPEEMDDVCRWLSSRLSVDRSR
uniref:Alpha/beta hydrolase n=1 Tax=Aegilops tauschii subsp. strangulata TaxID=200361 RepID=A0A453A2E4_AEGTS